MRRMTQKSPELLILGAGWTSTFLIPLLDKLGVPYAATTRDGRGSTIPFKFIPESDDLEPYKLLPLCRTILITFPLTGEGQAKQITSQYTAVHNSAKDSRWILLGSSSIFTDSDWNTCDSSYDKTNKRVIAEDELLGCVTACVLNLSGLYGGARHPKNWIVRVAKTKQEVRGKKALHLIHGEDVARGILAVHEDFTPGKRWLLTDLHCYDWWALIMAWGGEAQAKAQESGEEGLDYVRWVGELMIETDLRALPRPHQVLGRKLDARDFWNRFGWPSRTLLT